MNDVQSFFTTVQFSFNFTTPGPLASYSTSYYSGPADFYKEPVWLQILLAILFATITVLGVGGNAIVIYIVLWNRRMRTPTNYFIVNLAVSDFLSALMCINFTYYATMYMAWPFGRFMCKLVQFVQNASISVSIFTLVVISLDRYFVILYPLRPKLGKTKALIIISLIWVCSCAFACPVAIHTDLVDFETFYHCSESDNFKGDKVYSYCAICVQYVLPLIILGATYGRIGFVMWSRKTPGEREEKRDKKLTESKLKVRNLFLQLRDHRPILPNQY
ncbi:Tachykinin-like peptides receptor 99D [Holothuria leucospilota]|uniref:Tachykinin-like peptides receptor 99D n=1 Tax=Holothuria leucospilota TaxID=206669 RepID=A0A9Q0YMI5_HOLLE|nr:Tachykinin-like peptides receptor 99D [Holothuria leucospilota]